jgi:RNA polymerase sigma factor (TIGR02999 family)
MPRDPPAPVEDITGLLLQLEPGDDAAADRLYRAVYATLHEMAARAMSGERDDHTLQPTALVHEAYLKLVEGSRATWRNRAHFLAVAARAMRQILVDHARRHRAAKRGLGRKLTLDEALVGAEAAVLDVVALDEALTRLAAQEPRCARVVELRFFGGLDVEQTAEALSVSPATVKRDWQFAKAWLGRELRPE